MSVDRSLRLKVNDPNRHRHKFNQVIESPLRVRGEFLKDDELTNFTFSLTFASASAS